MHENQWIDLSEGDRGSGTSDHSEKRMFASFAQNGNTCSGERDCAVSFHPDGQAGTLIDSNCSGM